MAPLYAESDSKRRRHNPKAHVHGRNTVKAGEALKQGLPTRFRDKDDSSFVFVPDATFTVTLKNTKRKYLESLEAKKTLAEEPVSKKRKADCLDEPLPVHEPRKKTASEAWDELIAQWEPWHLKGEDYNEVVMLFFVLHLKRLPSDEAFARLALEHSSNFVEVGVIAGVMAGELDID